MFRVENALTSEAIAPGMSKNPGFGGKFFKKLTGTHPGDRCDRRFPDVRIKQMKK